MLGCRSRTPPARRGHRRPAPDPTDYRPGTAKGSDNQRPRPDDLTIGSHDSRGPCSINPRRYSPPLTICTGRFIAAASTSAPNASKRSLTTKGLSTTALLVQRCHTGHHELPRRPPDPERVRHHHDELLPTS